MFKENIQILRKSKKYPSVCLENAVYKRHARGKCELYKHQTSRILI